MKKFFLSKRGQISVETLFAVGIVFILFSVVLVVVIDKRAELRDTESFLELRNECFKVANMISEVSVNGEGTNRSIKIRNNISVQENYLFATDGKEEVYCSFAVNVSNFSLVNGNILIQNRNGRVVIEND